MDADKTFTEKARQELPKNAIEQFLEATTHETAVVQPLTSHHLNHPNKTN